MKIPLKTLSLVAMAAAPFLFVEMSLFQASPEGNTRFSGICDLIYMTGWTATIVSLLKLAATGKERKGRLVLYIQLITLGVAQVWNIWTIADPGNTSVLYTILDYFWPLSNLLLLAVGIVIAAKGILKGWYRWTVLAAGLWLPVSILCMVLLGGMKGALIISGIYSSLAWFMMGNMIFRISKLPEPDWTKAVAA